MAAKTENEEIVKICLRIGVDPFMKNKKGKIAMELAKKPSLRDLLKQGSIKTEKTSILYLLYLYSSHDKIKGNSK